MVNNALEIGLDLIDMKDACQHGEWMPWLKEIGLSASTAANYMRIAREVSGDSKVAQLPYTKILALMAAPKEDREALAEAAESMSAAEIRKLTEERNKAAEAANAETMRADQAEKDAKMFNQEAANLRNKVSVLQNELNKQTQYNEDLRGKLLYAENNRVEVEKWVEVVPEDYERLKKEQKELLDAAAKAEERANEAEAKLERIQMDGDGGKQPEKPVGILLNEAVNTFLCSCDMMTFDPVGLQRDAFAVRHGMENLQEWINRIQAALEMPVITEANVI
jgi:chromosome segregation ATPase